MEPPRTRSELDSLFKELSKTIIVEDSLDSSLVKRLTLIEAKVKASGSGGETNKENAAKSPASNPGTEALLKDATSPNQPKRKSNPNTGKKSNCEVS